MFIPTGILKQDFSQVTICIFTRNRPDLLKQLLKIWSRVNVNVLVLDGSNEDKKLGKTNSDELSNTARITWVEILSMRERMFCAANYLDTELALFLADDDMLPYQSVLKAKKKLRIAKGVDCLYSSPQEFNSRFLYRKSSHGESKLSYSTLQQDSLGRVNEWLHCPIDRHFFGFFRAVKLKKSFLLATQDWPLNDLAWVTLLGPNFELSSLVTCKTLYFKEYDYLKRKIEDPKIFSRQKRLSYPATHYEDPDTWKLILNSIGVLESWYIQLLSSSIEDVEDVHLVSSRVMRMICERGERFLDSYREKEQQIHRTVFFKPSMCTREQVFLSHASRVAFRVWDFLRHTITVRRVSWALINIFSRYYPIARAARADRRDLYSDNSN